MKRKFMKLFAVLALVLTLGLSSCAFDRAQTYNYWKSNSSEYIGKDHIVEKISISKLNKMVNNQKEEDVLFVFFGNNKSSSSQNAIKVFNEQAIQYGVSTLYWVDSDLSDKDQKTYQDKLGISDLSYAPALYVFKNKIITFDSSRAFYKNNSSKYPNVKLAQIAFKSLYDNNGEYVED